MKKLRQQKKANMSTTKQWNNTENRKRKRAQNRTTQKWDSILAKYNKARSTFWFRERLSASIWLTVSLILPTSTCLTWSWTLIFSFSLSSSSNLLFSSDMSMVVELMTSFHLYYSALINQRILFYLTYCHVKAGSKKNTKTAQKSQWKLRFMPYVLFIFRTLLKII